MGNKRNYSVGYGVPPDHTKYKRGQSGNLSGRPKVQKSLLDVYLEEIMKPVPVTADGKTKMVSGIRAFAMADRKRAFSGHAGTAKEIRGLILSRSAMGEDQRSEKDWEQFARDRDNARNRLDATLNLMRERMEANEESSKAETSAGPNLELHDPDKV